MSYLSVVITALIGTTVGYFGHQYKVKRKSDNAHNIAEKIIIDAKNKSQEITLKAKEEAIELLNQARIELQNEKNQIKNSLDRLTEREHRLDAKYQELDNKQADLDSVKKEISRSKEALDKELSLLHASQNKITEELQRIAKLTNEEAKEILFKQIEEIEQENLINRLKKAEQRTAEQVEAKARKILALAIDRFASSQVVDMSTTSVELPSDEMKGRIIGKEGRNIKAIENLTGCEIIIDDTPQAVTISGFSPVRRQVAKKALEMLIKDGRIQPAKIEECIEIAKKDLAKEMYKAGEEALYELGIPVSSIDPKLISILGRLKFRTSYGQNVLQHSIEVARISGMIAAELGADVANCIKGGLFHDIGKAVDHDMQGAHPEIGYNIMKKFGWPEELCYQSIAHHEDRPRTLEGTIVKAADAISGARPGARRNSAEDYIQRLQALEATASEFEGVEKAYAIQAGREVRVFVRPEAVNDYEAFKLANQIAKKIERDLTYPGEVRVTIIRETRITEVAH
jgi:ribonuclease Y